MWAFGLFRSPSGTLNQTINKILYFLDAMHLLHWTPGIGWSVRYTYRFPLTFGPKMLVQNFGLGGIRCAPKVAWLTHLPKLCDFIQLYFDVCWFLWDL